MKKTYKSIFAQMVYVSISGLQLLFIPNIMLQTFGFPPTHENWIRVMGLLVLSLNFYYYNIAKYGSKEVVMGTVCGRTMFCVGLTIFGLTGLMPLPILIFALLEFSLTIWTWFELKKS